MDSLEAAKMYVSRQTRLSHPGGKTDGLRWYPDPEEKRDCCNKIRCPSRHYPWSLSYHCRTMRHVSSLTGIPESEIRRALISLKVLERIENK
jgi:hypothetical protein